MASRPTSTTGTAQSMQIPERERRLRAVFERSRNAMLIADDDRRYRDVNDAACRLLGARRAWIVGRRIDDFTVPESRPLVDAMWRSFIEEGTQAGEFELLLPNGERRTVEYSATANIAPGMHLSILLPLVAGSIEAERPRGVATSLTTREAEVIGLIALGANTKEIAERLAITHETARSHTKNAIRKLGARNRAHAVVLALAQGELTLM